jgi:hypothetical protein
MKPRANVEKPSAWPRSGSSVNCAPLPASSNAAASSSDAIGRKFFTIAPILTAFYS